MSEPSREAPRKPNVYSRTHLVTAVLGVWLACTSVLWQQARVHRLNALVTGAVILAASLLAPKRRQARSIVTVAAVWLLISDWALPLAPALTFWNNLAVAFAVFFVSLLGPEPRRAGGLGRGDMPRPGGLAR